MKGFFIMGELIAFILYFVIVIVIGIFFFVSPCDIQSVDEVDKFVDYYSIHSSDLTNIPLV